MILLIRGRNVNVKSRVSARYYASVFARGLSLSTETIIGDEREPRRTKWRNQSRVAEMWRTGGDRTDVRDSAESRKKDEEREGE